MNVNTVNWALCLFTDAVMFVLLIGFFEYRVGAFYLLAVFCYPAAAEIFFVQLAALIFMPNDQ
jgi:hypothetical protein